MQLQMFTMLAALAALGVTRVGSWIAGVTEVQT
jgi:hypothetical protein